MAEFMVDPLDEDMAITDDGELVGSVRMLPIDPEGRAPTFEELSNAPIIGYGGRFTFVTEPEADS